MSLKDINKMLQDMKEQHTRIRKTQKMRQQNKKRISNKRRNHSGNED